MNQEDEQQLCVHFLPFGVKIVANIVVDKFKLITVRRGYDFLKRSSNPVEYVVQLGNHSLQSPKKLFIQNNDSVFPIISVNIILDKGKLKQIDIQDQGEACQDQQAE